MCLSRRRSKRAPRNTAVVEVVAARWARRNTGVIDRVASRDFYNRRSRRNAYSGPARGLPQIPLDNGMTICTILPSLDQICLTSMCIQRLPLERTFVTGLYAVQLNERPLQFPCGGQLTEPVLLVAKPRARENDEHMPRFRLIFRWKKFQVYSPSTHCCHIPRL